jgi:hypothetical protein
MLRYNNFCIIILLQFDNRCAKLQHRCLLTANLLCRAKGGRQVHRGKCFLYIVFWGSDNFPPSAFSRALIYVSTIKPEYFQKGSKAGRVNEGINSPASYLLLSSPIFTSTILVCFFSDSPRPYKLLITPGKSIAHISATFN